MESFGTPKTPKQLDQQLTKLESFFGNTIKPENLRKELLSKSFDEIKNTYPDAYRSYFSILKTEANLQHFPDVDKNSAGEYEKPKVGFLPTTTRGNSFKLNFSDSAHVIKPLESTAEKNIAITADTLGIGPKQFKSKENFLHEEFIDGVPLLELTDEQCTPEFMEKLGQKFSRALRTLHENNILVNDQIITNDFGKSHTIIDKAGEVRFIDFGAAVDITDYPNITDEEVLSLMRTDSFMMFRIDSILTSTKEEQADYIQGYRENILAQYKTKEDIINWKDTQLLYEGISFLGSRLPNVGSFVTGITKEK